MSVITEVSPLFFSYIICIAFVFFPLSFKKMQRMGVIRDLPAKLGPISSLSFQLEVDAMTSQSLSVYQELVTVSYVSVLPEVAGTNSLLSVGP